MYVWVESTKKNSLGCLVTNQSLFCNLRCLYISIIPFQNHLLSVFDNTRLVTFDEKVYDKILEINSQEGETVRLDAPVLAQVNTLLFKGFARWLFLTPFKIIVIICPRLQRTYAFFSFISNSNCTQFMFDIS